MKFFLSIFLFFLIVFPTDKANSQSLKNVAGELGLVHSVRDNHEPNFGGGVSFVDIDKNGFDDIIISNGEDLKLSVYLNQDGNSFIEHDLGLVETFDKDSEMTAWADYDNDGDLDLYITYALGRNRLYRQDPGFIFTDVSDASGLDINTDRSSSAVWADFDNDGHLDLFVATFLQSSSGARNLLFHNRGDGTFEEKAVAAGVSECRLAFSASILDYDLDGLMDIYVTNDKKLGNQLFKNLGNMQFRDVGRESGAGIELAGMGIAIGDYDNDGDFDIYAANEPPANFLLQNNGDGSYSDVTLNQRVGNGNLCWGGIFGDFNLDGWVDLHVSVSGIDYDGNGNQLNGFYINRNGSPLINSYVEANAAGINEFQARSWGSAIGDYNNDGLQDLAVYNNDENFALWKNETVNSNSWIKIDLEGTRSNRDGIGARVKVFSNDLVQSNYRQASMSYKSQSSSTLTFSIGLQSLADSVEVLWPSGEINKWYNLNGNQRHLLVESLSSNNTDMDLPNENRTTEFFPNPFSSSINFIVRGVDQVNSIEIFDAMGRSLYRINDPNTNTILQWKGLDSNGENLAPGLYFAVISSREKTETIRFLKQ